MNRPLPAPASDIALVVSRLILAVVMFAHGYQKLFIQGIGKTTDGFQAMNIPLAIVSASFVTALEVAGSILLLAGALTTVVCVLYLVEFAGAATLVHLQNGLFVQQGGAEYVLVIIAFFLCIAAVGPGRYSVDAWMRGRQKQYQRDLSSATGPTPAVPGTGSFTPVVAPRPAPAPATSAPATSAPATSAPATSAPATSAPAAPAPHVPAPSAPLSFTPTVAVDAPMTDPRPFTLPAPFAPAPGEDPAPVTEAIPVALPRRTRPAHASR